MIYFVSHWSQAPANIPELIAVAVYLGIWFMDEERSR